MYFMIIRPQNKRNKEIADMVSQVEKGTEIIGAGGISWQGNRSQRPLCIN